MHKVAEEGLRQYPQGNVFYDSGDDDPYGLLGRSATGVSLFIADAPFANRAILGQTAPSSRKSTLSHEQLQRRYDVR